MRGTSLWTVLGIVAVAGAFLSLPGARTEVGAGVTNTTNIRFAGYRCHSAKNAKGFKWNKTVLYDVITQLGGGANTTTLLTKPAVVCSVATAQLQPGPANGSFIPILPDLVCFKTKDAKGTPKLSNPAFHADDDLGAQDLLLGRGNLFCIPLLGPVIHF
jgi:hypothetical protein